MKNTNGNTNSVSLRLTYAPANLDAEALRPQGAKVDI